MAVGGDGWIVGAPLEVTDLVGIFKGIKPAGTVEIGDGDAPIFYQVEAFLEAGVIRAVLHVHVLVAAEADIAPVAGDRGRAEIVTAGFLVEDACLAGFGIEGFHLVPRPINDDFTVRCFGQAARRAQ